MSKKAIERIALTKIENCFVGLDLSTYDKPSIMKALERAVDIVRDYPHLTNHVVIEVGDCGRIQAKSLPGYMLISDFYKGFEPRNWTKLLLSISNGEFVSNFRPDSGQQVYRAAFAMGNGRFGVWSVNDRDSTPGARCAGLIEEAERLDMILGEIEKSHVSSRELARWYLLHGMMTCDSAADRDRWHQILEVASKFESPVEILAGLGFLEQSRLRSEGLPVWDITGSYRDISLDGPERTVDMLGWIESFKSKTLNPTSIILEFCSIAN